MSVAGTSHKKPKEVPGRARARVPWAVRRTLATGVGTAAVCSAVFLALFAYQGNRGLDQGTAWLVFGLFAMSVDFLWGYSGVLSIGQAIFFGLGGYCYAWMTTPFFGTVPIEWNASLLGCLAAMAGAGIIALVIGYLAFYGKFGANIWVFTLALSFVMTMIGYALWNPFGGYGGIGLIPPLSVTVGDWTATASSGLSRFITITIILTLSSMMARYVLCTRFGLLMIGIRDNEERSLYLGINTNRIRLIAFVLSSIIAGLAGALYAAQNASVVPDLMGVSLSLLVVMWVLVGGRGTLIGGVVGTLTMSVAQWFLGGDLADVYLLVAGGLLVAIVLSRSGGVVPMTVEAFNWARGIVDNVWSRMRKHDARG